MGERTGWVENGMGGEWDGVKGRPVFMIFLNASLDHHSPSVNETSARPPIRPSILPFHPSLLGPKVIA